jgi:hypothetical protein
MSSVAPFFEKPQGFFGEIASLLLLFSGGSAIGLSATGAWGRAAAGDGETLTRIGAGKAENSS